jgi:putative peptide zinc metalloprotease protein
VLTALVGARSSQRLRRMFGRATRQDDEDDGDSSSATTNGGTPPTSDKGAPRKIGRSVSRQLLWAALAAAVLALLFVGRMQLRIRGGVSVLPHVSTEVRSEVEGIVAEVLVSEGDRVQRGAVLARLSGRALVSELAQTDAAIREADAELAKQVTGPTGEEIAVAEAAVARGRDRLSYAEAKVERINELFAAKSAPRQELEDAQADAAAAANDLREARARLDVLRRGTRPEDIAATRARVEKLGAQRTFALDQRSRLDIVAPVSGVIATPARQLMLLPGQLISRGAMIATIYDYQTVSAHLVIAERDIGDVRVGQPVVLRTRAYPDVEFRGRVTSIATAVYGGIASPSSAGTGAVATGAPPEARSFVVTTDIENPELLLKPGMSGEAKILAGERRIADLVTRRLYRILRVEVWSWW